MKTSSNKTLELTSTGFANELTLSYRKTEILNDAKFAKMNNSRKIASLLRSLWNDDDMDIRESFYLLCFSNRLDLLGFQKIAEGGIDAVLVDIRILFSTALLCRSSSIVVCHNHPSGSLEPSQADRVLTRQIYEAGKLLNIALNDHIILTAESYLSFRDEGLL